MRIFVPDVGRQVLAGARALARAGHEVTLGVPGASEDSVKGLSRHRYSRYLRDVVPLPLQLADVGRYLEAIVDEGASKSYDVILPFGTIATAVVALHRDAVRTHFAMAVPPYELFVKAHDKAQTFELMAGSAVPIPMTHKVDRREGLDRIEADIGYPAVVKARVGSGVDRGLRYASTRSELESGIDSIEGQPGVAEVVDFSAPIVQEYIPGDLYDVCALFNQGEPRALLVQQRVLMFPVSGGVGAVNRTVDVPELLELGKEVGRLLRWHGPAQIEFKYDYRDKKYKLIEVNPKLWGTVDLSIRAGINFPELAARLASEGDVPTVHAYKTGVTYKWLGLVARLLAKDSGSRKRALQALSKPLLINTYYDFSARDPLPDLVSLMSLVGHGLFAGRDGLDK